MVKTYMRRGLGHTGEGERGGLNLKDTHAWDFIPLEYSGWALDDDKIDLQLLSNPIGLIR